MQFFTATVYLCSHVEYGDFCLAFEAAQIEDINIKERMSSRSQDIILEQKLEQFSCRPCRCSKEWGSEVKIDKIKTDLLVLELWKMALRCPLVEWLPSGENQLICS